MLEACRWIRTDCLTVVMGITQIFRSQASRGFCVRTDVREAGCRRMISETSELSEQAAVLDTRVSGYCILSFCSEPSVRASNFEIACQLYMGSITRW